MKIIINDDTIDIFLRDITENLESALEQFKNIYEDLEKNYRR